MGLDVYVGSFTRYYRHDWETVVQKYARQKGIECTVVRPDNPTGELPPPQPENEVRGIIETWRRHLNEGLAEHLEAPLDWDESSASEYFTDKPAWDCYGGLVLLAAYDEHPGSVLPRTVPNEWERDAIYLESFAESFPSSYNHLLRPEMWLPCRFGFTFKYPDPGGKKISIGSTITLLEQLRLLNERTCRGAPKISRPGDERERSTVGPSMCWLGSPLGSCWTWLNNPCFTDFP